MERKINVRKHVVLALGLTLLLSCSDKQTSSILNLDNKQVNKAISTRSQNLARVIRIVELQGKPLSQRVKKVDGDFVIDAQFVNELKSEHKKVKQELQAIDSSIKVIYDYFYAINGFAISVSQASAKKIKDLASVSSVKSYSVFNNNLISNFAKNSADASASSSSINEVRNSSSFIGADKAKDLGYTGEGITVAVIDSGIDYSHKVFQGEGTKEAFEAINPSANNNDFPTEKVIAGFDLVGSNFDPSSVDPNIVIPKPDENPLDQTGHGTHVAGTIAGEGDGINTFDGVAPDAKLLALKVFGGPSGSTAEYVVLKAFELAIDPNQDFDLSDRADVVNLSLGELYGTDESYYQLGSKLMHKLGVSVVAAAGNSGNNPFIVSIPSTVDENISVAASVDDSPHIIDYDSIEFEVEGEKVLAPYTQGSKAKKLEELNFLAGESVYLNVEQSIEQDTLLSLKDKIIVFNKDDKRLDTQIKAVASYGIKGVVVVNDKDQLEEFKTARVFAFPVIMIPKTLGELLILAGKSSSVVIDMKPESKFQNRALVDLIAPFSSRGPRLQDAGFKPEITAPGFQIISAKVGSGDKAYANNGTSMASPHIAGAVAILKQKFPSDSPDIIKSKIMNSSRFIENSRGHFPITMQGAGRIDILRSLESKILMSPAGLSLGIIEIDNEKTISKTISISNISDESLSLKINSRFAPGFELVNKDIEIEIDANSSKDIELIFKLTEQKLNKKSLEVDGVIKLVNDENKAVAHLPILSVLRKSSKVNLVSNTLDIVSQTDKNSNDEIELVFENNSSHSGKVAVFNHLITDAKETNILLEQKSNECDLHSAGYRIVSKTIDLQNKKRDIEALQFGIQLHEEITNWSFCDVSILIDVTNDGVADYELAGNPASTVAGLDGSAQVSLLIDIHQAKKIRSKWEQSWLAPAPIFNFGGLPIQPDVMPDFGKGLTNPVENYVPAIVDFSERFTQLNSSVSIVEISKDFLRTIAGNNIKVKILTTSNFRNSLVTDDYAGDDWITVSLKDEDQSFKVSDEFYEIDGGEKKIFSIAQGNGDSELLLLYPDNNLSNSIISPNLQRPVAAFQQEITTETTTN